VQVEPDPDQDLRARLRAGFFDPRNESEQAMNKEQKAEVVEKLTGELKDADAIFAIDYRGMSVPQAAELRSGLREADASFNVVKNRLTLRAADAAGTDGLKKHLVGPTALTFVKGDVALAAKTLDRLGGEWDLLEFKGGLMGGDILDADSFKGLAKLPGRDQLNAQFAGIVASPITGLVRGLGSMVQGLALQLQAIADQGLVTGEAPKDDSPEEPSGDSASPAEASQPDTPAGEAEDVAEESSDGEADTPPTDEASEPDPEPTDSPEEEPSEEEAPEGEEAGEQVEGGGEGDADIGEGDAGEASESEQAGDDDAGENETSEETSDETSDTSEDKENE
jgi:large subunit ribosomal protein L10